MRTVILVHGFWHGSWVWSPVATELAARGIPSVVVDLEGHGLRGAAPEDLSAPSPLGAVTATSAATLLLQDIRKISGGEPCVVVAHSMGGIVATLAAEMEPALFSHLLYVSAVAPVRGLPAGAYVSGPDNEGDQIAPMVIGDPGQIGALRLDVTNRLLHDGLRQGLYADVDAATAAAAIGLLTTDAPLGVLGESFPVTAERYGSIPHSYLVCTQDNAVRPALQHRIVAEIDCVSATATRVTELEASHSPMLSRVPAVAEAISTLW